MNASLKRKQFHNTLSKGYKEYMYFGSLHTGFMTSRNRYTYRIEGIEGEIKLGKQITLKEFILNLHFIANTNLDNVKESKHKDFFVSIQPFAKLVYEKHFSNYSMWVSFKRNPDIIDFSL